jgi:hypothetical protein
MPKQHVEVIKIPLKNSDKLNYNKIQGFPRMPRLYLELVENKAKVKQDLINKEYVPVREVRHSRERVQENFERKDEEFAELERRLDNGDDMGDNIAKKEYNDDEYSDEKSYDSDKSYEDRSYYSDEDRSYYSDEDRSYYSDEDRSYDSEDDKSFDIRNKRYSDSDDERYDSMSGGEDVSNRLKELLEDSESEVEERYKEVRRDKYSRGYEEPGRRYKKSAPTLAELQQKGAYKAREELRDINQVPMTEYEEEDAKRELMFKFELLKKSYKSADVPEFTIHSDLNTMQKTYDGTLRRLTLDSTVDSYKTYLIGGFMVVEFICGNWLGFDMQGFTQQQMISMSSYEKLLIELGEKSYMPEGSSWPVEVRLLFLIIINAAFFIISKMIMKKTGANLLNMINGMNTNTNVPHVSAKPKRKMKGPSIDLDDIPDIEENSE